MNSRICLGALLALLLVTVLPSCTIADPEYLAEIDRVTDTNYPPDKIAGVWINFDHNHFAYQAKGDETRVNYMFNPGGTGQTQQFTKFVRTGHSITIQAPLTWTYQGNNRWTVFLPDSSKYRVISKSKQATFGYVAARQFDVRYGNGRLYVPRLMQIMVSPEEAPAYIREQRARLQQRAAVVDALLTPQPQ